jgi:bacterioferritin-associated ferredoxin
MTSSKCSSLARLAWAIPVATACFGCAREAREPVVAKTTTTTTVSRAPVKVPVLTLHPIGGGPRTEVEAERPERLDTGRAERMVDARIEQLRNDCFAPDDGLTSFAIDVDIGSDGRVDNATTASVNGDERVAECVRGHIERMTFPRSAEGGTHTFTFLFGR